MPRQKDLKRLVRARMRKTGEAYTAARRSSQEAAREVRARRSTARGRRRRAFAKGVRGTRGDERRRHQGEDWIHVGAMGPCGQARCRTATSPPSCRRSSRSARGGPRPWRSATSASKVFELADNSAMGATGPTKSCTFNVPVATLSEAWADSESTRATLVPTL